MDLSGPKRKASTSPVEADRSDVGLLDLIESMRLIQRPRKGDARDQAAAGGLERTGPRSSAWGPKPKLVFSACSGDGLPQARIHFFIEGHESDADGSRAFRRRTLRMGDAGTRRAFVRGG